MQDWQPDSPPTLTERATDRFRHFAETCLRGHLATELSKYVTVMCLLLLYVFSTACEGSVQSDVLGEIAVLMAGYQATSGRTEPQLWFYMAYYMLLPMVVTFNYNLIMIAQFFSIPLPFQLHISHFIPPKDHLTLVNGSSSPGYVRHDAGFPFGYCSTGGWATCAVDLNPLCPTTNVQTVTIGAGQHKMVVSREDTIYRLNHGHYNLRGLHFPLSVAVGHLSSCAAQINMLLPPSAVAFGLFPPSLP